MQIDQALLEQLQIDGVKLESNLNRIPEGERTYLHDILSLINEKKGNESLPLKQDIINKLGVTYSKANGIIGLYKAANIISENKVVRIYQYDVHKNIKRIPGSK